MGWLTAKVPAGNTTSPPISGRRSSACWISALVTPALNVTTTGFEAGTTPAGNVDAAGFETGVLGTITPPVKKINKHAHTATFAAGTLVT